MRRGQMGRLRHVQHLVWSSSCCRAHGDNSVLTSGTRKSIRDHAIQNVQMYSNKVKLERYITSFHYRVEVTDGLQYIYISIYIYIL